MFCFNTTVLEAFNTIPKKILAIPDNVFFIPPILNFLFAILLTAAGSSGLFPPQGALNIVLSPELPTEGAFAEKSILIRDFFVTFGEQ